MNLKKVLLLSMFLTIAAVEVSASPAGFLVRFLRPVIPWERADIEKSAMGTKGLGDIILQIEEIAPNILRVEDDTPEKKVARLKSLFPVGSPDRALVENLFRQEQPQLMDMMVFDLDANYRMLNRALKILSERKTGPMCTNSCRVGAEEVLEGVELNIKKKSFEDMLEILARMKGDVNRFTDALEGGGSAPLDVISPYVLTDAFKTIGDKKFYRNLRGLVANREQPELLGTVASEYIFYSRELRATSSVSANEISVLEDLLQSRSIEEVREVLSRLDTWDTQETLSYSTGLYSVVGEIAGKVKSEGDRGKIPAILGRYVMSDDFGEQVNEVDLLQTYFSYRNAYLRARN